MSLETKAKISQSKIGTKPWNKGKIGLQKAWNKGKSADWIKGNRNPNWKGGISKSNNLLRGSFEYLFVNWGQCCKGTNSTYEVRVGRAEKITIRFWQHPLTTEIRCSGFLF